MYNSPNAVLKGIKAYFAGLFVNAPVSNAKKVMETVTSDGAYEDYWIPSSASVLREWIDEIAYSDGKDYKFTIFNKDFGGGFKVKRNTLSDSRKSLGGNVEKWIKQIFREWITLPDTFVEILLEKNGEAFDGTAFFANSRNLDTGDNTIDNIYSGTGVTDAKILDDFEGAYNQLIGFKDKNNNPFNRDPKLAVYVPAHLANAFRRLFSPKATQRSGSSNIYAGEVEIIVNYSQAGSNNDWYLLNTAAPFKPFILQEREKPTWNMKDEKDNINIKYFTTGRYGYGYGNPTAIIKVDNT